MSRLTALNIFDHRRAVCWWAPWVLVCACGRPPSTHETVAGAPSQALQEEVERLQAVLRGVSGIGTASQALQEEVERLQAVLRGVSSTGTAFQALQDKAEPLRGYGVRGPCSSIDPSRPAPCLDTGGGTIQLGMRIVGPESEVLRGLWDRANQRYGAIERCHLDASRIDPALKCRMIFVESAERTPETQPALNQSDCPSSLNACLGSALATTTRVPRFRPFVEGAQPAQPFLFLFFAPGSYHDPRSEP